jgi:hypothetical protein
MGKRNLSFMLPQSVRYEHFIKFINFADFYFVS